MSEPTPDPRIQVMLNGGVYPNEDGTWRVCCWFTGISTEAGAATINQWLTTLLQANITAVPPPEQPAANGGPQP